MVLGLEALSEVAALQQVSKRLDQPAAEEQAAAGPER
jgi:hypothetical protein